MNIEQAINKAKELAKKDYDDAMIKCGAHNPKLKRKWREVKLDNGKLAFALTGTPDKAFVMVSADKKQVFAINQAQETLASFNVEA